MLFCGMLDGLAFLPESDVTAGLDELKGMMPEGLDELVSYFESTYVSGTFRKIERPRYGYFLDHSCDGFATMLVVIGIGVTPYVQLEVALIALAGYLLMSIHAFLSVRVLGELRLSYFNAGPTELRLILIGLTLAMLIAGLESPIVWELNGFDLFVGGVGLILIALFVLQTFTTARRLAKQEPAPDWHG